MPASPCYAKECGRFVVDGVVASDDVAALRALASDIMQVSPGGSGGPTILDLHSGRSSATCQLGRTAPSRPDLCDVPFVIQFQVSLPFYSFLVLLGALSYKESFINVYPVLKKRDIDIAKHPGFDVYK
jgi:hypothetical protein